MIPSSALYGRHLSHLCVNTFKVFILYLRILEIYFSLNFILGHAKKCNPAMPAKLKYLTKYTVYVRFKTCVVIFYNIFTTHLVFTMLQLIFVVLALRHQNDC